MKIQLKRPILNGEPTAIEFKHSCEKWLVKNFTDGDIYVAFENSSAFEESAIKIASGCGQVCFVNEHSSYSEDVSNIIYIKGTGEVEVQQLCYR